MTKRAPQQTIALSIEHLWCLIVLGGILIFVNTHPLRPHDFWWHMAAGREVVRTGRILTVDTFSHTMRGTPYPSYTMFWLVQVAFYAIYSLGGPALIVFAHGLVITSAYALLLFLARRVSGNWRVAALSTLFAAALGLHDWNVRPQAVAFPIAALFLYALHAYRQHPRRGWLALFPLGMVIWANSHGTFPLGLLLIGTWPAEELWAWLAERWQTGSRPSLRRLRVPLLTLAISALACLLNPRGVGIVGYVTGMTGNPLLRNFVPEWAAPTFDTLGGQLFYGGLLLSIAVLALSPRRPTPVQLLTFLAFAALGLQTRRGSVWFGLVAAPLLAEQIGKSAKRQGDSPRVGSDTGAPNKQKLQNPESKLQNALNAVLAALVLIAVVITLPWFKPYLPLPALKAGLLSEETPVAATEFLLEAQPPGRLFNELAFGSYLIWEAQTDYPVFVDPRLELYPLELWMEYIQISAGAPGWEERLEGYGVRTLMVSPELQPGLVEAARASGRWEELYKDRVSVVLTLRE